MNSYQEDGSAAGNPTPKDPPAAPDHTDRTAGGFGGRAPASLDVYGQSSTARHLMISGKDTLPPVRINHAGAALKVPNHPRCSFATCQRDRLRESLRLDPVPIRSYNTDLRINYSRHFETIMEYYRALRLLFTQRCL